MKQGCTLVLLVLFGAFAGYFYLLQGSEFESKIWIPILLAFGASIVVANLYGIVQALKQGQAAKKPRSEWRDQELVAVSGPIQPMRAAIQAPFSGLSAALVEYAIKRQSTGESAVNIADYQGFLMTPCGVYSSEGLVRLVGFPLLNDNLSEVIPIDPEMLRRSAQYLSQCTFMQQAKSPLKALKQLTDVLSDDDGLVRADFCKGGTAHIIDSDVDQEVNVQSAAEDLEQEDRNADQRASEVATPSDPISRVAQALADNGYTFEEKLFKVGEEVTAIGTYRASTQSIDIGSGLKNLAHSLQRGAASQVTARNLRRCVIATLFWGAVVGYANWYVLKSIGLIVNAE